MERREQFLKSVEKGFPDDRLTWQKGLATFHPESADEAARFIQEAGRVRQPLYITGFGNNIDPVGERFRKLVIIRTDRLNSVIEISDQDLFVRVGSGYPLKEINLALRGMNLYTPHAALPYVGSAGGAVAVNLTAELNGHGVPIKKYLLQAEVVTPEGRVIHPGSVCFKSVSGYDVVKIFAASWGLLGLLVSATFRVMPVSAADEFAAMKMKAIDREHFLSGLDEAGNETDALYSRKIKARFDPHGLLPMV
jgi:glycolate oxidase